jgi:hypothetical protein
MAIESPLSPQELTRIDAWWRAGDYLSAGQVFPKLPPVQAGVVKDPGTVFLCASASAVARNPVNASAVISP